MTGVPRISAAVITLNEAANLPGLLRSLVWTDEVVVVDGGSQDSTVEIARDFGCRVLHQPFDTFAAQRNRALQSCTGDWILSIDADERCTPPLIEEVRARTRAADHAGYRVPIRRRIFGRKMRYSGTQDDRPIRLFLRTSGRWQGDVHEVLRLSGRVGQLQGWLEHETLPDLSAFLTKMERYTTLEARRRVAEGVPPRWRDMWLAPAMETARRMFVKGGLLDGPQGWAFCVLSGLSQWVLAHKHRWMWTGRAAEPAPCSDGIDHMTSTAKPQADAEASKLSAACGDGDEQEASTAKPQADAEASAFAAACGDVNDQDISPASDLRRSATAPVPRRFLRIA